MHILKSASCTNKKQTVILPPVVVFCIGSRESSAGIPSLYKLIYAEELEAIALYLTGKSPDSTV